MWRGKGARSGREDPAGPLCDAYRYVSWRTVEKAGKVYL